jgi:hypothetical protein
MSSCGKDRAPGVAVGRHGHIDGMLPMVAPDLEAGAIVTVEDTRVRVRSLPVA